MENEMWRGAASPVDASGGDVGETMQKKVENILSADVENLASRRGEEATEWAISAVREAKAATAEQAGVQIVTGDTKVVDRGSADKLFINTTGVGILQDGFRPTPSGARPGDVVLVSGPLGRHGIAIMAVREGLADGTFDVTTIDSTTVAFGPGEASPAHAAEIPKVLDDYLFHYCLDCHDEATQIQIGSRGGHCQQLVLHLKTGISARYQQLPLAQYRHRGNPFELAESLHVIVAGHAGGDDHHPATG